MNSIDDIAVAERQALVQGWQMLFEREPPANLRNGLLRSVLAWNLQATASGWTPGASKPAPMPISAPTVRPGTRLLREWKGSTHEVLVLANGFEHDGKTYRSLSSVARAITGTPWSGPLFFGIKR